MEEEVADTVSSESDSNARLEWQDDDGWEDAEPDQEEVKFTCLFCQHDFSDISSMLQHCKSAHEFDLPHVQKTLGV